MRFGRRRKWGREECGNEGNVGNVGNDGALNTESNDGFEQTDHSLSVVRQPGRRRGAVLYRHLQELENGKDHSLYGGWDGGPRAAGGQGFNRRVRAQRTAVHRPERRPAVQVHRSDLVSDHVSRSGGGGPLLEQAERGW